MNWRQQVLDSDSLPNDRYARATYKVQVPRGVETQRAVVDAIRLITARHHHNDTLIELDSVSLPALLHSGERTPDSWLEVVIGIPDTHWSPAEGLSRLLELFCSVVEYEVLEGAWLYRVDLARSQMLGIHGPNFGVRGVRTRLDAWARPLLAIELGPRMREYSRNDLRNITELLKGGFDAVVDDMLVGAPVRGNTVPERIELLRTVKMSAQEQSGRPKFALVALSGTPRKIYEHAELAIRHGLDGFVVNAFVHGFGVIEDLRELHPRAIVITTNMGSGMASRPPRMDSSATGNRVGVHEQVFSKFSRLAGADAVHAGTSGTICFDVPWGDAIRALDQEVIREDGSIVPRSFRVAEGSLRLIDCWSNIRELGADTILELPYVYLEGLAQNKPSQVAAQVVQLINNLSQRNIDDSAAQNIYVNAASKLGTLQNETDEKYGSANANARGPRR